MPGTTRASATLGVIAKTKDRDQTPSGGTNSLRVKKGYFNRYLKTDIVDISRWNRKEKPFSKIIEDYRIDILQ